MYGFHSRTSFFLVAWSVVFCYGLERVWLFFNIPLPIYINEHHARSRGSSFPSSLLENMPGNAYKGKRRQFSRLNGMTPNMTTASSIEYKNHKKLLK